MLEGDCSFAVGRGKICIDRRTIVFHIVDMFVSCCYNVIKHAAMMTELCCNNIVIKGKKHCWQRCSCCMASSTLSISCWPAQLCPYHVGRFNFVHIMLANSRRWELMLCVRQPKEIIYISRFLVIINWNKLDITVQFALNDDAAFEDGGQITFITSTFFVHLFSSIRFTIESHFLT